MAYSNTSQRWQQLTLVLYYVSLPFLMVGRIFKAGIRQKLDINELRKELHNCVKYSTFINNRDYENNLGAILTKIKKYSEYNNQDYLEMILFNAPPSSVDNGLLFVLELFNDRVKINENNSQRDQRLREANFRFKYTVSTIISTIPHASRLKLLELVYTFNYDDNYDDNYGESISPQRHTLSQRAEYLENYSIAEFLKRLEKDLKKVCPKDQPKMDLSKVVPNEQQEQLKSERSKDAPPKLKRPISCILN